MTAERLFADPPARPRRVDHAKLTARQVIDAVRGRHSAAPPPMPAEWTVLEEYRNVDVLAWSAWGSGERIGYEVKVSRGDMRRELLDPSKTQLTMRFCHRVYFAVPAGLLTKDELAWKPPKWEREDFERPRCTNEACRLSRYRIGRRAPRASRLKGDYEAATVYLGTVTVTGTDVRGGTYTFEGEVTACCVACRGTGATGPSRVEREAPTLWVPAGTGLVEVHESGVTRVRRPAPPRAGVESPAPTDHALGQLVRFASMRPDPRHHPPRRQE